MRHIAFVTYQKQPEIAQNDRLLVKPLKQMGIEVSPAPWDDDRNDWQSFDLAIFRSCWDYHLRFDEFTTWLTLMEKLRVPIWNPVPLVRWNAKKTYLLDLEKKGIPTIPTILIHQGESKNLADILNKEQWTTSVVKPIIGAWGYKVFKVNETQALEKQKDFDILVKESDVVVQKFMEGVTGGEWSLVFFGGKHSHSFVRIPKKGDFRVNYAFGGIFHRQIASQELIQQAENVIKTLHAPTLYSRVDLVVDKEQIYCMELELIEPYLYLDKTSAEMFAGAIAQII